jgi:hypothetical protein
MTSATACSPAPGANGANEVTHTQDEGDDEEDNDDEEDDDDDDAIQSTMETRAPLPTQSAMPCVLDQEAGARGDARDRLINGEPAEAEDDQESSESVTHNVDWDYVSSVSFCIRSLGKGNQAIYMPDVSKIKYCRRDDSNGVEIVPMKMASDMFCDHASKRAETTQWLLRTYGEQELCDAMIIIASSPDTLQPAAASATAKKYTAYARINVIDFHKGPNKLEADVKGNIGLFPLHCADVAKMIKKQNNRIPKNLMSCSGKLEYMIISPKTESERNDNWIKVVAKAPPKQASKSAQSDRSRKRKLAAPPAAADAEVNASEPEEEEEEEAPTSAPEPASAPEARPPKTPRHRPPNAPAAEPAAEPTVSPAVGTITTKLFGDSPPGGGFYEQMSVKEHKQVLLLEIDQAISEGQGPSRGFSVHFPAGVTRVSGQLRLEL